MAAVVPLKLGSPGQLSQFESGDTISPEQVPFGASNMQTGTTYTLAASDAYVYAVLLDNAAAIALAIPTFASASIPVGCAIPVIQTNGGAVTISAASGVTLNDANGATTTGQGDGRVLQQIAQDDWVIW